MRIYTITRVLVEIYKLCGCVVGECRVGRRGGGRVVILESRVARMAGTNGYGVCRNRAVCDTREGHEDVGHGQDEGICMRRSAGKCLRYA